MCPMCYFVGPKTSFMSAIYTVMLAVLAILAISGLYVGLTNDAVNFLNAAIGSKVAKGANRFRIADAIDEQGMSVDLKFIDFVKVQTAVNSKSGWLGEVSTEVLGFYDYSMME